MYEFMIQKQKRLAAFNKMQELHVVCSNRICHLLIADVIVCRNMPGVLTLAGVQKEIICALRVRYRHLPPPATTRNP